MCLVSIYTSTSLPLSILRFDGTDDIAFSLFIELCKYVSAPIISANSTCIVSLFDLSSFKTIYKSLEGKLKSYRDLTNSESIVINKKNVIERSKK